MLRLEREVEVVEVTYFQVTPLNLQLRKDDRDILIFLA